MLSIVESRHSLEDVYLELIDEDPEAAAAMRLDAGRIRAVVRKEFRALRRNRFIIGTMAVLPLVFLITPMIEIFRLSPGIPEQVVQRLAGSTFLLLLIIPVVVPGRHRRLLGGGRARAGDAGAAAHHPAAPRGAAARQGGGGDRPLGRASPTSSSRSSPSPPSSSPPTPRWRRRWCRARSSSARSSSRRSSRDGRSGWASPSRRGRATSGWPSSWAPSPAFRRWASSRSSTSRSSPRASASRWRSPAVLLVADLGMWRVVSAMFDRERLLTGARATSDRARRAAG